MNRNSFCRIREQTRLNDGCLALNHENGSRGMAETEDMCVSRGYVVHVTALDRTDMTATDHETCLVLDGLSSSASRLPPTDAVLPSCLRLYPTDAAADQVQPIMTTWTCRIDFPESLTDVRRRLIQSIETRRLRRRRCRIDIIRPCAPVHAP